MTRWMFPYIGFMSMVALSAGILNTWRRFAVPAATPVLLNLSMIGTAWLLSPWLPTKGVDAIYALPVGVMLGGVLQLAVQVPALKRLGLLPRLGMGWTAVRMAWRNEATRRILVLMGPALLGVGVAQISLLINTQIASHLAAGSVSWLSYADRLMEFPTAMLGVALGAVLMPQLAAAKAAGDTGRYAEMLDWGLRLVVLLALPCAVALLVFAPNIVWNASNGWPTLGHTAEITVAAQTPAGGQALTVLEFIAGQALLLGPVALITALLAWRAGKASPVAAPPLPPGAGRFALVFALPLLAVSLAQPARQIDNATIAAA